MQSPATPCWLGAPEDSSIHWFKQPLQNELKRLQVFVWCYSKYFSEHLRKYNCLLISVWNENALWFHLHLVKGMLGGGASLSSGPPQISYMFRHISSAYIFMNRWVDDLLPHAVEVSNPPLSCCVCQAPKEKKQNRSHISKQLYSIQMFAYLDTMHLQHVTGPSLLGNILN